MKPELIAQTVFVLLSTAFFVFAFARWLPWIGRLLAIYGLHGLRDQFYDAAREYPAARSTQIYRDLELTFCFLIKIVRERKYGSAFDVFFRLSSEPTSDKETALRKTYSGERDAVFTGEAGQRALDVILSSSSNARRFVALYVYLGHPVMQVFGLLCMVYYLCSFPVRWMSASGPSLDALLTHVAAVELANDPPPRTVLGRIFSGRLWKRAM